jgi:hypothetical protein
MLPTGGRITPNIQGGVGVDLKLKAEGKSKSSSRWIDLDGNGANVTNLDWGIIFGGGLDIDTGSGMVVFDVRYMIGQLDVDDIGQHLRARNRALTITAGYGF